jgi:hypothetical protein
MDFGGSGTPKMPAELILQFSTLRFCSLERVKMRAEKKKKKQLSSGWARIAASLRCLGLQGCYVL